MGLQRVGRNIARRMRAGLRKRQGRGTVLIAGTGRAGTTFLMRICVRLGLDTGFSDSDISKAESSVGRAGLERKLKRDTVNLLPEIIKSPNVHEVLADALSEGWIDLDCAIIPVRSLDAASNSRNATSQRALAQGNDPLKAPGGLWKTDDPDQQKQILTNVFYQTVQPLVAHDVPIFLISFPEFANDVDYFVSVVGEMFFERFGVHEQALRAAHAQEARPQFIGNH